MTSATDKFKDWELNEVTRFVGVVANSTPRADEGMAPPEDAKATPSADTREPFTFTSGWPTTSTHPSEIAAA